MDKELLKDVIFNSQKCQRNWDLNKTISATDLDILINAATNCPSKQNEVFYKLIIIKNREMIESVYNNTKGFHIMHCYTEQNNSKNYTIKNTQTLANILFIFCNDIGKEQRTPDNIQFVNTGKETNELITQRNIAIGIASGYVNLVSHLLGYKTGYCSCFDKNVIGDYIGEKNPRLILGIGYPNSDKNRSKHHIDKNISYMSFNKNINYKFIL